MIIKTDFLVIGSGIAGLSFALKAATVGTVAIITKKEQAESNTNYAQGGLAAVFSADDSFELHIEDTLKAGAGLCHRDVVELLVKNGPTCVRELVDWGVRFSLQQAGAASAFDLGREGGHSRNRIVHARDLTGKEIEQALLQAIKAHPNIQIFEQHIAIDLITEHHLALQSDQAKAPLHCWGAYVLDEASHQIKRFLSRATILSTGGCGRIYLHTTNPVIATGDGIAMAYRAGAKIANLEFMQFHPTTLYHPQAKSFLISEAVRGFGARLITQNGARFMEKYHPMAELAPRDIVARAIDAELKKRGEEFVYLDITHKPAAEIKTRFPHIYENCLKYNFDITSQPIPVVPAAHYMCGGVVTDIHGRTNIENLYACGEVACTGVHGANRLASNSLLEAVVFAHQVYQSVINHQRQVPNIVFPEIPAWNDEGTFNHEEWVLISHDQEEVQRLMWDYVGIVRSNLRLQRALRRVNLIAKEIETFYKKTKITAGLVELRNLVQVARLIINCALYRKESRGLHYTTDYPERDDKHWLKDTILIQRNGKLIFL
ncbi:MAG: L-aspartate oxidase [candidate division KSB1 bacterium]|nr:L-aspartate oxidase [candidate division KSB1 bacterium]